jgi:outer membrane immunogenic protein
LLALTLASPALAADLSPLYKAPPPPAPIFSWTGFYAGVNIGYSWGNSDTTAAFSGIAAPASSSFSMDGVIGGGQIGYNWQSSNWVFGLEADIQGSGQNGSTGFVCPAGVCTPGTAVPGILPVFLPGPPVFTNLSQRLDWFGTVRARLGTTITPTFLAYVTGGLAYGEVDTNGTVTSGGLAGGFSSSATNAGWTVGGGIEAQLSGNWTGKIEYLYMDLGTVSGGPFPTLIPALGGGFLAGSFSSHITDNIVRVGLNYKF